MPHYLVKFKCSTVHNLESGHLASLARLPGITYLRTCNTALTLMYSRKGLRHFCSKVHSSQIDFILVSMYFTIVSAPGHFCIAALYKSSMYCIVLYCIAVLAGLICITSSVKPVNSRYFCSKRFKIIYFSNFM